jgi:RNA polymerase sigma-70 factor (ECF subfamily)
METLHTDTSNYTDEHVLAQSIENPDAFAVLVSRYEQAFARKARMVLRNEEDVEDVVQETFVKIYSAAGRFRKVEGASFKSWGYRILMNTSFTRYKKRMNELGRTAELTPEHFESLQDEDETPVFKLELSDYVLCIFSKMPEQLVKALDMHFLQGLPQQDIAEREGVTVGAIKTRVHRAKAEFRAIAEQYSRF